MDVETRKINAILKILDGIDPRSRLRMIEYLRSRVESEMNVKENRVPEFVEVQCCDRP